MLLGVSVLAAPSVSCVSLGVREIKEIKEFKEEVTKLPKLLKLSVCVSQPRQPTDRYEVTTDETIGFSSSSVLFGVSVLGKLRRLGRLRRKNH